MNFETIICLSFVGALGALFKDVVADGKITLPRRVSNGLELGFIGSMFLGAVIGWLADNSPITAFCAGFAGFSTLSALIPAKKLNTCGEYSGEAVGPVAVATAPAFKIRYPFLGNFKVSQYFGQNPAWYKKSGYAGHFGIDFLTPNGTSIRSVDSGVVTRCGFTAGNGNFIELHHSWGYSLYLHLSDKPLFALGQLVMGNVTVGYAGNTGAVRPLPTPERPLAGTHLHFSIKVDKIKNKPYKDFVDPMPYFKEAVK